MYFVETGDGGVRVADLSEWSAMFEDTDGRRVARDTDGVRDVSTVFLGLEHGRDPNGQPYLYETMVFRAGSTDDLDCERYITRGHALAGHAAMCAKWLNRPDLPPPEEG